jgi:hypothetical protein
MLIEAKKSKMTQIKLISSVNLNDINKKIQQ